MKSLNNGEFIKRFINFYGNGYNLDEINYINANTKIKIKCLKHGYFEIIPYKLFKNKLSICKLCRKDQTIRVKDTKTFILKANLLHNNRYNYSKTEYKNNGTKLIITCLEHGDFELKADDHLSGLNKCPKCKPIHNLKEEKVLEKFHFIHLNKYKYPNFKYNTVYEYINIKCPNHGIFKQKIMLHLRGHGCKLCANDSKNSSLEDFITKANYIHNNKYDYTESVYINNRNITKIKCFEHGVFEIKTQEHLNGIGCLKCVNKIRNINYLEIFKIKASKIHSNKYDYSQSGYINRNSQTIIICSIHGKFYQTIGNHLQGCGCPSCAADKINYASSYEREIIEFLKIYNVKILPNYYKGNKEIDIYLPEYNLGLEINGVYWHSHLFKDKKYHKDKSDFFEKKGIKIFHIWEHQWVNPIKKEIIKSMILNKIKQNNNKIYARKCEIKEILPKEYREFCNLNHIQGYTSSLIKIGLFYNNELVACMGFGGLRINMGNKQYKTGKYELIRYCSKKFFNVVGGASRLLSFFIKRYKPSNILSFADNDYSNGNLYKILGFKKIGFTNLSYVYYNPKEGSTKNRFCYRKSELTKQGADPNKTEFEITHQMGLYRLFNSGVIKYELNLDN